jgi:DNA-binding CsgD family transcriptional regulator
MGEDVSVSAEFPMMENLSDLIAFVQRENPDLDELCQFAVIRTFNFLQATAMFGATLESDGTIRPKGQFGFSTEVMKSWKSSSIDEDIPTADALKTNNIIWLGDKSHWLRDYPHLAKYENDFTANTFIAWPISVRGAYMSVLGLCARDIQAPTPSLISFFETVGGIFAMQLSQLTPTSTPQIDDQIAAQYNLFTRRQRDVIRLVADGLTNQQIGTELGFSESTIRQETMRIYEILGASGRTEAIKMYRSLGVKR